MSGAWNHAVRELTPEERVALKERADRDEAWSLEHGYPRSRWAERCRQGRRPKKCKELATHVATYAYVTGRGGRVSSQERLLCAAHAEVFREAHCKSVEVGSPS